MTVIPRPGKWTDRFLLLAIALFPLSGIALRAGWMWLHGKDFFGQ